MNAAPTPVVTCPGHTGHAPAVEVQCGRPIPAFDVPARIDAILTSLAANPGVRLQEPSEHDLEPIHRVHGDGMLDFLRTIWKHTADRPDDSIELIFADTFCHEALRKGLGPSPVQTGSAAPMGRYCFDTITGVGPETWAAAIASVDTALTAADLALAGAGLAVGLCRPPGHHVGPELFGGGCYLNNAGITAQWLRDHGMDRVAVLDVDFHHGNGTQSLFYDRADVLYTSLHGDPARAYPYFTGFPEEVGTGTGTGYTLNLPLPPGVQGEEYLALLRTATARIAEFDAQAIVVSLGFDTFAGDVSGDAVLTTTDFRHVGRQIAKLGLPAVALLEGGYSVNVLGDNLSSWIDGFRTEQGART
jgi:acetoin utilization deacetylase AcuC-like enzyme